MYLAAPKKEKQGTTEGRYSFVAFWLLPDGSEGWDLSLLMTLSRHVHRPKKGVTKSLNLPSAAHGSIINAEAFALSFLSGGAQL